MPPIIIIKALSKTYAGGFQALKSVDLTISRGEIFANCEVLEEKADEEGAIFRVRGEPETIRSLKARFGTG